MLREIVWTYRPHKKTRRSGYDLIYVNQPVAPLRPLSPVPQGVLKHDGRLLDMGSEIGQAKRRRISAPVYIRHHRRNQRCAPLRAHHGIQVAIFAAVAKPELKLPEAEGLLRFGDGFTADAIEDEFAPDLIVGGELDFPGALTS